MQIIYLNLPQGIVSIKVTNLKESEVVNMKSSEEKKRTGTKKVQKATINDVANLAGVVQSTVSHVLNGTAPISQETTERVLKAIEKLNYSPNALARALRQKSTRLIGVVLQDISSEFYAKCAASILEEARKDHYVVLLCDASFNNDNVKEGVNALIERRVDGLIFIGGGNDESIIQSALSAHVPVVLGDRHLRDLPSVEFDNETTVKKLVCALYEAGFRRFVYAGEPVAVQTNLEARYKGYIAGLLSCGISQKDSMVILNEELHHLKLESAYQLFKKYFGSMKKQELPEVILTSNDMIAHGFISAAKALNIKIPEDIAVVGFDDINISKYFEPSLTTIAQDEKMLGKSCYELFMKVIKEKTTEHIIMSQEIKIRESAVISKEILDRYQDNIFKNQ